MYTLKVKAVQAMYDPDHEGETNLVIWRIVLTFNTMIFLNVI